MLNFAYRVQYRNNFTNTAHKHYSHVTHNRYIYPANGFNLHRYTRLEAIAYRAHLADSVEHSVATRATLQVLAYRDCR